MSRHRLRRPSRRDLLAVCGVTAIGSLSGCTGTLGLGEETATAEGGETTDGDGTDSPLGGHPAGVGVDDQPRFGPPPTEAEGVVVAFEDPSCPRCAAFETGTVPKIRDQLGDRVSFVFRGYPVVYPWGEPATQAIEAAFAAESNREKETTGGTLRTESGPYGSRQGSVATWRLIRHYFENQSRFDADNVLDLTRDFLAAETDLDADAVVADAESKARDDAVQADLDAGEAADVGNTTPTVFLFRDGEFRTTAKGSISFEVVQSALGL